MEQSPESAERDGPVARCPRGTRVRETLAPPESGIVSARTYRNTYALVPLELGDVTDDPPSSAGPVTLRGVHLRQALVEALRPRPT